MNKKKINQSCILTITSFASNNYFSKSNNSIEHQKDGETSQARIETNFKMQQIITNEEGNQSDEEADIDGLSSHSLQI
ncbi:CFC_HP_G0068330.mRNA.1.CDS.1 [Saccharomyces cerevisiae]|nr:CFC_HP_G0068330.mRNA.1.CDS.1 [Saccharomyces cerevisiae]CAI6648616.1 CFC_HP_G0068330.mRNA.1.CDS.1 [Saccharomyces cerevisiae]